MRILHTADWHLGRLFHGEHLTEEQAKILFQFIEIARDTRPQVILITGDIFDRVVPPTEAIQLLDEILSQLVLNLQIPTILLAGNHDSPERLKFGGRLFEKNNLFLVTEPQGKTLSFEDDQGKVVFYVYPFLSPYKLQNLFKDPSLDLERLWQRFLPVPKGRSVLCTHAWVKEGELSSSETEIVGGAEPLPSDLFSPYSFCALGHLHKRQTIGGKIHYPGAIFPYSFREADQSKGVSLIDIGPQGEVSIEFLPLALPKRLVVLEGKFEDLIKKEPIQDFVKIILKDQEPVFEAFRRLKRRFPYLVALEQPCFQGLSGSFLNSSIQRRDQILLFRGFMKEVTGKLPSSEEELLFKELLVKLKEDSNISFK